jgi:hypothetical protein
MHITETTIRGTRYCYAAECKWNPGKRKYDNPSKAVGKLGVERRFVPNRYFSDLLVRERADPGSLGDYEKLVLGTVRGEYGAGVEPKAFPEGSASKIASAIKTATVIFHGPQLVFGSIAKKYKIEAMLADSFGAALARDILSLAWYITSEGSALSNNDGWLDYFENPSGSGFSSQEVSRLLDMVSYDGIMTFYKHWLKSFNGPDKVLYDLTSISYYGTGINAADWGYNRDNESLPQVNYALLCARSTGMPLFAWPLAGSISDVSTLENTLQFLGKLGYKPNCLMLDRAFPSKDNIAYLLRHKYVFLQALKVNAKWVCGIIDAGEAGRLRPDSMLAADDRTYYASTAYVQCVRRRNLSGEKAEGYFFYPAKGKRDRYKPQAGDGFEVIEQYPCQAHVLFCQGLVGNNWDRFMGNLNSEHARLLNDPQAKVKSEYAPYFVIAKPKYARKRTVDFDIEAISNHKNKYTGYVCFLTNDPTVKTAEDALKEYSTRDYIEKDFDEMKNGLDMDRLRVHTDGRMRSRLFIQFIAEIFLRDIRVRLRKSDVCRKMTKAQIFSHIKAICKVHFQGKYKDVTPQLSKKQRSILEALEIQI